MEKDFLLLVGILLLQLVVHCSGSDLKVEDGAKTDLDPKVSLTSKNSNTSVDQTSTDSNAIDIKKVKEDRDQVGASKEGVGNAVDKSNPSKEVGLKQSHDVLKSGRGSSGGFKRTHTDTLLLSPLLHSLFLYFCSCCCCYTHTHTLSLSLSLKNPKSPMGSRIPSHQLSNGLVVSGRPEQQLKERQPTMASRAVPYTGGDVKKSGELGKMFDIPIADHPPHLPSNGPPPSKLSGSRPSSSSQHNSGSVRSGPNSGQISKKSSGPLTPQLQPTGLITSGPLGSGPLGSGPRRSSGQLEHTGSMSKVVYGSAVTTLSEEVKVEFRVSKAAVWVFMVVVVMGLLVGGFLMVAVKKWVILVAVALFLVPVVVVIVWNYAWGRRGLLGFVRRYPDAELRGAIDGQYVKVTGVVTCGSIPLESSYQRVPRCVYVSTELCKSKGCSGKSENKKSRHSEKYVADFYISDFQSGLRALVKAGYGAKVAPFVKPATVVDVTKENKELSPSFLRWLAERNLSTDDRIMRLKEGYIKEGSTVSVMGVVRRHDNVVMIVPPTEPVSTGFQWLRCLLPTYVEGLILTCDDNQNADVVPV